MTKSTITRDESIQAVFDLNVGYTLGLADIEILKRVARIAMAAMDSEPDCKKRKLLCSTDTARMIKVISVSAGTADAPLYRHQQPAPIVPEEATPDSIEILASARRRDHAAFQWDEDQRNAAADSWNACRAAMLAAAPHDTPALNSVQSVVTAPVKWIPVSERMPPSRHEVLVGRWWGENPRWCCKWATYIPGHPDSQSSGWLIPGASWTPTHWMPLPAAPQEVKGE